MSRYDSTCYLEKIPIHLLTDCDALSNKNLWTYIVTSSWRKKSDVCTWKGYRSISFGMRCLLSRKTWALSKVYWVLCFVVNDYISISANRRELKLFLFDIFRCFPDKFHELKVLFFNFPKISWISLTFLLLSTINVPKYLLLLFATFSQ